MDHLENEETQTPETEQETPLTLEDILSQQSQPEAELQQQVPQAEQLAQPAEDAQIQPEDGFYHGAGTGQVELTNAGEHAEERTADPQPQSAPKPQKGKGKRGRRFLKGLLVSLMILALVAAGCYISVLSCNRYWHYQFALLYQNMNEKYDALQSQIDSNKVVGEGSGTLVSPEGDLSAADIYRQNVNSVVAVNCQIRVSENGKVLDKTSSGTGFIITQDGYIVTNHHVIEGATKVVVTLHDGTALSAVVVGSNDTNDIAVIKTEAQDLDPVTIGSSSQMQVGDQVVAIGNALGEFSSSLTVGYVSGMDRSVSTDGTVINMIQTDAAINSGNSGGPLFNAKGEVIGITSAKYSGTTSSGATIEGIGFAIPMDDVIDMIEDLRDYGYIRSAFLGVMVWEVDAKVALTYNLPQGVYVEEVTPGYCAEKAGVCPKDIIIELGGYQIKTKNDLSRALRNFEAGTTVTIVVWRSGHEITMSITLDEKPAN